ncbi:MAG: GGDEF domain-containing protein [Candidatus Omnitrophota bacterium]
MPNRKLKINSSKIVEDTNGYFKTIFQRTPVVIMEKDFSILRKLRAVVEKNKIKNVRAYLLKNRSFLNDILRQIKINHANDAALRFYGVSNKKELSDNFQKTIHRESLKVLTDGLTSLLSGHNQFEAELKTKNVHGKIHDIILRMSVSDHDKGSYERVIIAIEDITLQKKIERNLRQICQTDGLTEVFNHSAILKRLEEEFKRAIRYDKHLSCLMIDLDHFKGINDLCGHQKGDKVLKLSAQKIKNCVREVDIVGRYGGDEFLVILPETPMNKAGIVADRLIKLFDELSKSENKNEVFSSVSIGIGGVPNEGIDSPKKLVSEVDKAMYKAKKIGRNTSAVVQL